MTLAVVRMTSATRRRRRKRKRCACCSATVRRRESTVKHLSSTDAASAVRSRSRKITRSSTRCRSRQYLLQRRSARNAAFMAGPGAAGAGNRRAHVRAAAQQPQSRVRSGSVGSDQVYTGIDAEHPETTAAVDATAGQVLRYGNALCAGALFVVLRRTHGIQRQRLGRLADCVSFRRAVRILRRVPVVQVVAAHSDRADAAGARVAVLRDIGDVIGVTTNSPDPSGRARFWTFTGASGSQTVKAEDVRRALGTRVLPSLLVRTIAVQASDACRHRRWRPGTRCRLVPMGSARHGACRRGRPSDSSILLSGDRDRE